MAPRLLRLSRAREPSGTKRRRIGGATKMFDKSAADFMNDQLEALLASPALARVAQRRADPSDEPAASEKPIHEGDLVPSTREHGVWGTKSDAVGGFGESYSAQVAHGSEPNLPNDAEEAP